MVWKKVIEETIEYYNQKISGLEKQVKETRENAAKSPGSMQSWSDKSKQEFSQLADSLSKNLQPLKNSVKKISEILTTKKNSIGNQVVIGSIVKTKESGEDSNEYLLIVPGVGGDQIKVDEIEYFLLSENSNLAKELLVKKLNSKIVLKSGIEISIVEIINS